MKLITSSKVWTLVALSSFALSARAGVPESCWTSDQAHVAGEFIVDLDTSQLTKDELMQELAQFSRNLNVYIVSPGMLILPDQNYISFVLAPNDVSTTYTPDGKAHPEPQAHVEARVNPEIQKLSALEGVSIRCEVHPVPLPGISVSN